MHMQGACAYCTSAVMKPHKRVADNCYLLSTIVRVRMYLRRYNCFGLICPQSVQHTLTHMHTHSVPNSVPQHTHMHYTHTTHTAEKLLPFKGTTGTTEFVKKRINAYQARLQRIGHFLLLGKCVWWHRYTDGCILFHDAFDDPEFSDAGPVLLHFQDVNMEDVLKCSRACWQDVLKRKVSLPIRCYDSVGNVTALASCALSAVLCALF